MAAKKTTRKTTGARGKKKTTAKRRTGAKRKT